MFHSCSVHHMDNRPDSNFTGLPLSLFYCHSKYCMGSEKKNGPAHEVGTYQKLFVMANDDVSRGAGGLNHGLILDLHPYFVYASSKGSGELVNMHTSAYFLK